MKTLKNKIALSVRVLAVYFFSMLVLVYQKTNYFCVGRFCKQSGPGWQRWWAWHPIIINRRIHLFRHVLRSPRYSVDMLGSLYSWTYKLER